MKATGTCVETGKAVTIIVTRIHDEHEAVEYGPFRLDADGVFSDGDRSVRLTPTEATMVRLLMQAKGVPLTHEALADLGYVAFKGVYVYVSYLRKKGVPIVSRRGYGYTLSAA